MKQKEIVKGILGNIFGIVQSRRMAFLLIAMVGIISMIPIESQGGYAPCSTPHACKCVGTVAYVCSDGYWYPAGPGECPDCGTTTTTTISPTTTTTTIATTTTTTTTTSTTTTTTVPPSDDKTHGNDSEPVNTATGEYYFEIPVFNLGGPLPLTLSLYYGSLKYTNKDIKDAFNTYMGYNWLHSFNIALVNKSASEVHIIYDKGKVLRFLKTTQWTLKDKEDVPYQLKDNGSSTNYAYYLMDPSKDLVYKFDANGKLMWIKSRNNNTLTFTYSGNAVTSVSDGLGRTLTFTYEALNLTKICDGNNRCVQLQYDSNGWVTGLTDVLGNKTTYEYYTGMGKDGLITRTILPKGNAPYVQTYDTEGRVATQKDAYNNTFTFSYQAQGKTSVQHPDLTTIQHTHVNQQLLTEFIDEAGRQSTLGYDSNNRRTQVQDNMNNQPIMMTYHAESGKLLSLSDSLGFSSSYTYTVQSQSFESMSFTFYNLTRIDYSDSSYETFTYDSAGNILTQKDRLGNQTVFTYNSRGQVLTETNAEGGKTENGYNTDGTVAWGKTTDTGQTTYNYDSYKRLIKETYPDGTSAQKSYDLKDRIISETDTMSSVTQYQYDANGNKIKIIYPNNSFSTFEYDLMDRLIKSSDNQGGITQIAYNSKGAVVSVKDKNNITHQYGYDSRGRKITETDGGGKVWKTGYDDEGIPISRTTPMGFTTNYQLNDNGQVVSATNAMNETKFTSRDNQGRITSEKDALNRTTSFTYNNAGIVTQIQNSGISAGFTLNALGQIEQITDNNGNKWSFEYTQMGRLTELSDPLGRKWTRTYDSHQGRLKTITYPDSEVQTMTYDNAGNLTKRAFSSGLNLTFSFDSMNQMTASNDVSFVMNAKGKITKTTDGSMSFDASYTNGGRLNSVSYANNLFQVNYTYNSRGLLSEVTDTLTQARITFSYDDDGRITRMTRTNGVDTDYTWDNAGRLLSIQDDTLASQQYSLNDAGEIVQAVCDLPLTPSPEMLGPLSNSYSYNAALEVQSSGYAYDNRGRMTTSPLSAFQWDGAGRLTRAGQASLTYNGLGDLRTRTENNVTTHYYYNYGIEFMPIAGEKNDTAGTWKRFYVWSPQGKLLYMIDAEDSNAVSFYHFDRLGSTTFLTDETGQITDKYAYAAYGRLLAHEGNSDQPFTFVGQRGVRMEGSTGIYHMRSRCYDSMTARFLSRDSQWPDISRIHGTNPYLYAAANPLLYSDSTGNDLELIEGIIGLFVENYTSLGAKRTNNKFINALDDLGKLKYLTDLMANQGGIATLSKWLGISGGITCNVLSKLYPLVPMQSLGNLGLNAARCRIPMAPFKIMNAGKVAGKAFVLLGGAISLYEMTEWSMSSPQKAAESMQASLSYRAVELAEKVPGLDYAIQGVGNLTQKAIESGVVDHTVGYNAPGAKMVEFMEKSETIRDYIVRPTGRAVGWIFGYGD